MASGEPVELMYDEGVAGPHGRAHIGWGRAIPLAKAAVEIGQVPNPHSNAIALMAWPT